MDKTYYTGAYCLPIVFRDGECSHYFSSILNNLTTLDRRVSGERRSAIRWAEEDRRAAQVREDIVADLEARMAVWRRAKHGGQA